TEKEIDQGPEWRAFNTEEKDKRARTGAPTSYTIHDKGLSTIIDWHDKDSYGRKISPKRRAQIYRLRKWQIRTRVHSSSARNLVIAMSELDRLASQLGIPRGVKESAAVIYRRAIEQKIIRGRSIEAMIAAAIYAACRLRKVPRTLDEICQYTRIKRKELGRSYRLIIGRLGVRMPVASPIDYLSRFGEELNISSRTQKRAAELLELAKEKALTAGKDPTGLAAAAIYIVAIQEGERRTQREIAKIAHVTEVTVRNRYKELVKKLHLRVDV
ncbi:MAG: transcription initiation factor IIB, partial [Promethearchaeota archaeon]